MSVPSSSPPYKFTALAISLSMTACIRIYRTVAGVFNAVERKCGVPTKDDKGEIA